MVYKHVKRFLFVFLLLLLIHYDRLVRRYNNTVRVILHAHFGSFEFSSLLSRFFFISRGLTSKMPLQTVTSSGEDGSCRPMKKLGVVAKAVTAVTGSTDRQGMARTQRDVKNGKTPGLF